MAAGIEFTQEAKENIKRKIIEYFLKTPGGTFASACISANISFAEAYTWRNEEPDFNEAVIKAREAAHELGGDFAESKLLKSINEDNLTGVMYYLNCKHKHRGYGNTTQVRHADADGGKLSFHSILQELDGRTTGLPPTKEESE